MPAEVLYGLLAFLAAMIISLIGVIWHLHTGAQTRIFNSLEQLRGLISELEAGLRGDLVDLDRRVTRIEARNK